MSMQITRRNLIAAGAGLTLIPLLASLASAEPQDEASIENQLQQYESRFNQGDAEAVAELYGEDIVYYDPLGRVHEGRDAVERYYQSNLAAGFSDMKIDVIEIETFDDVAYDIARYAISGPQGQPLAGYHLAILAKEDGEWIVRRTLVNVVMPEPPTD